MATTQEYIEFVCGQIESQYGVRYRKMFGEYMVYVNDKPVLLVCDNTVYIKKLDSLSVPENGYETGCPYTGAKEHFILDPEDIMFFNTVVHELEKVIPVPVKKAKKKAAGKASEN